MSLPRPTGLKPPSKIGKPTGLPQPKSSGTGIPTPSSASKAQSAIAKSARAAGLSSNFAEKYAAEVAQHLPAKRGPDLPPPPPDDDFIVGDRVWVSGTKPGYIAFIGETQFAVGDWAGVVLDRPEGKNDGSVQGVRYFQCEPKRGVFAKISKLSRTPGLVSSTPKPEDGISEGVPSSVRTANGNMSQTLPQARPTTPKLSSTRALSTSSSSLNKGSPPSSSLNLAAKAKPASGVGKQLRIGDRVLVSGTKTGTLRYIGTTDFAKGEWAGVELDEKQGKNNGSVAGKRYFECQPMYGLFAPVHKVAKLASGSGPSHSMTASTPSPQTRSLVNTGLRLSRERSGSQESVSSISSTASSVSRSRVRLGVNSLHNQAKTSSRPSTLNLTATTQALQKALKEKEEHIEQLLRERDLERAEVARAAAQVDEAEGQLTAMKLEHDRQRDESDDTMIKLKALVHSLEQEKADLTCKLEDEKRKVEDLQFQIEEEAITKDDLENRTEEEEARLRDLERDLKREKERADKYEQEFYTVKAMLSDKTERLESTEEMNVSYLDQIEELTHKLSQAEGAVKNYEATRLEEGAKNSQVGIELVEKSNRVNELEEILLMRDREVKDLQERIHEVEEELNSSKRKKTKMQETVDNLSSQLKSRDEASNNLTSEIQNLKSQLSDLQRRLDASNDNSEHLMEEKQQMEQQMSEMMKNSGDSSNKLSMLNGQLQEKNRKVQDLQAALSNSTQQLGKLNDEIENLKQATIRERENLALENEEISKNYQSQLEDLQKELSKANNKMQQMTENHKKETDDSLSRKIREIEELKKQLQQSIEEQEKQEVQTQAHKQVLEKITMEKEALQFEKDKAEKQVKRLETEKESLHTDLVHVRAEVNQVQAECEKVKAANDQLQEQQQDVKIELKKSQSSKDELQKQLTAMTSERDTVIEERDGLKRDTMETKVAMQQKELLIEELQKEVEKMRSEVQNNQEKIMQMSQEESVTQKLQTQLDEVQQRNEEQQKTLYELESERDSMRAQLEFSNLVAEEKRRLEDQNHQMAVDAERAAERKEKEELEQSNTTLREELNSMRTQVQVKGCELDSLKQQVSNLKNENASLDSYRSSVQKMEKERTELNDKVMRLEASLTEAKTISPNMNSIAAGDTAAVAVLQEEKTGLQGQVDFLNSVIIDLQQKNKDLNHKIEILESGVITNGDHDSSLETEPPKSRAPPRLFCDICDVFDKHDTDDCPLQAMDYDEEGPSPTHYHGDRKASRPYCDICEEFHDPCSPAERPEGVPDIVLTPPHENINWAEREPKVRYHSGSETVHIGGYHSGSETVHIGGTDYTACSIFEDEVLPADDSLVGHTQNILNTSSVSSAGSLSDCEANEDQKKNTEEKEECNIDFVMPMSENAEDVTELSPKKDEDQNPMDDNVEIVLSSVNGFRDEGRASGIDNENIIYAKDQEFDNLEEKMNAYEVKEIDAGMNGERPRNVCENLFQNTTVFMGNSEHVAAKDNIDDRTTDSDGAADVIDQDVHDETMEDGNESVKNEYEGETNEQLSSKNVEYMNADDEDENDNCEDRGNCKEEEGEEEEEEKEEEEEEVEINETEKYGSNYNRTCDLDMKQETSESQYLEERQKTVTFDDFQSLRMLDDKNDQRTDDKKETESEGDDKKLDLYKVEGEGEGNERDYDRNTPYGKSGLDSSERGGNVEGNDKLANDLTKDNHDLAKGLNTSQEEGEGELLHDSAISFEDDNTHSQDEADLVKENKSDFRANTRSSNRDSGIMTDSTNVVDTENVHYTPGEKQGHEREDAGTSALPHTTVGLYSDVEDTETCGNMEESGTSVDNNTLVPQTQTKMEDSCRVS